MDSVFSTTMRAIFLWISVRSRHTSTNDADLDAADNDHDDAQPDDDKEMGTFEMRSFWTDIVNTHLRPVLARLSAKSHHNLLDVGRSILWSEERHQSRGDVHAHTFTLAKRGGSAKNKRNSRSSPPVSLEN